MPPERTPRFRLDVVANQAQLVIRGDELDIANLRADATRFFRRFPDWGRYGISGFLADDDDEIASLCETRLTRFATVVTFRREDLEAADIEVVATFRTPHVTLAHRSLEALVDGLATCDHVERPNPYFQA